MNSKPTSTLLLILSHLADRKRPAHDFQMAVIGRAAANGWINVVDGWAELTKLGLAIHESYNPIPDSDSTP